MAADNTITAQSSPTLKIKMGIQVPPTDAEGDFKASAAQAAENNFKVSEAQVAINNTKENDSACHEDIGDAPKATPAQESKVSVDEAVNDSKTKGASLKDLYTAVAGINSKRATVEDAEESEPDNSTKAPSVCDGEFSYDTEDSYSTTSGPRYPTRVTSPVANDNGATEVPVEWRCSRACIHAPPPGLLPPGIVLPPPIPAPWVCHGLTPCTKPSSPPPMPANYFAPSGSTAPAHNPNPSVLLPPVTPMSVWHNDRRQAFLANYPSYAAYQARAARAAAPKAQVELDMTHPYPGLVEAIFRNAIGTSERNDSPPRPSPASSNTASGSGEKSRLFSVPKAPFGPPHKFWSRDNGAWVAANPPVSSTTSGPQVYTAADRFNATITNTRPSVLRPRRHVETLTPKTTTPNISAHKTKNKWFTEGDLCVISADKELFRVHSGHVAAASKELTERIQQVACSSDKVLEFDRKDDALANANAINSFLTLLTSPHAFDHSDKSVNTPTEFMNHHKTIEFLNKYKCAGLKQQYCNLIYAWMAVRQIKPQYAFALVATMDNHKMSADVIARTPVQEAELTDADAENMTIAPFFHPLDPSSMEPYVYDRIPTFYLYALGRAFNGKTVKALKDKKILYTDFLRHYFERLTYKEPSVHGLRDMASMSYVQRFRVMREAGVLGM